MAGARFAVRAIDEGPHCAFSQRVHGGDGQQVIGGELLERGVSLIAVTAFVVSWVTVGSIQLPAEMLLLGKRFALYRNLICFGLSILIALLTVASLSLMNLAP